MLLKTFFVLAPLAAALPEAANRDSREGRDAVSRRGEPLDLVERKACDTNGCECLFGYEGVYCAGCETSGGSQIISDLGSGGTMNHVYQCDGNGGCCDYGYADDCADGATGRCG